ncbi:hypothetical protein [Nocardioides panzhihuensis]|uniref:Uncharacterized protein n=1 Tax=Nocardioides panzhihuensis TaxID=860243 RepID=A0A7Z0ISL8_9ACTN|nr:hypothetical protein [Nocardioides panzhihuensis]NYI77913.1 hypothetical protein [Nocardioides panzhihuensis]
MGYQTDFIGYLQVLPALNESERALVDRISGSIFLDRSVTGLRSVGDQDAARAELLGMAPNGWSNWTSCPTGCCLSYDGGDKANHMIPWLKYVMATFLVSGAKAEGRAGFEAFTCDHVLNGMVVGSRRDNRELYAITVRDNQVEVEMLWPGVKGWSTYPPLAYQNEIDRFREWVVEQPRLDIPDDLMGWRGW